MNVITMPWGIHKGKIIRTLPTEYLEELMASSYFNSLRLVTQEHIKGILRDRKRLTNQPSQP